MVQQIVTGEFQFTEEDQTVLIEFILSATEMQIAQVMVEGVA